MCEILFRGKRTDDGEWVIGLNHDACHCMDYTKGVCPKTCYRAELTEELRKIAYPYPTSWAHFKGTQDCPKWPNKEDKT